MQGRENSGPLIRQQAVPSTFYSKLQLYRRNLGHLSAVYCVLFDRTGKYVITGADDLLVKVWSSTDGRLLATFRGASAEIMDIAVSFDNTLLAAGSLDRILRIWCFQTMSPVSLIIIIFCNQLENNVSIILNDFALQFNNLNVLHFKSLLHFPDCSVIWAYWYDNLSKFLPCFKS